MMTEREKIISLAREYSLVGYYLKQDDFIEALYKAAQNEAYEKAAVQCDEVASDGDTYGMEYAAYCAEKIRSLKEQS